jgi:hypothetical protein
MLINDFFSTSYSDARANFLAACAARHVSVVSHGHPLHGPSGEHLACDVVRIGPDDATNIVVAISGTHGVEGYCGSGIQVALLQHLDRVDLGSDTALVLVHALNPYGFAWDRRVNEDNVDINRNFVDHAGGNYPENDLYEEIAHALDPQSLDDATLDACRSALAAASAKHGATEVGRAASKGQYRHPSNVGFGGTAQVWSNLALGDICRHHFRGAKRAALVDLHSGLGPRGHGEVMTPSPPGDVVYETLFSWFGDQVLTTSAPGTGYAGSKGSILAGFRPEFDGRYVSFGLEFGTCPSDEVRDALRDEQWLHHWGDRDTELGRAIVQRLRDVFYPDDDEWRAAVVERGLDVLATVVGRIAD